MPPAPGRASAWQACGPSQNVLSGSCSLACGDTFIVLTIIVYPMSGSPRFADRREELALLRRLEGRRGGQLLVVHGRRRVGKTALLARHLQTSRRRSIYLYIGRVKRDPLLGQLSGGAARQLQAPVSFRRWEALWDYVDATGAW